MNSPTITIAQIRALATGYFFDAATMAHFNTIIETPVIQGPGGIFFVTSDRYDNTQPKVYKVREYVSATGRILTDAHESVQPTHELAHARARAERRAATPNAPAACYA